MISAATCTVADARRSTTTGRGLLIAVTAANNARKATYQQTKNPKVPLQARMRSNTSHTKARDPVKAPTSELHSSSVRVRTALGRSRGRATGTVIAGGTTLGGSMMVAMGCSSPSDLGRGAAATAANEDRGHGVDAEGDDEQDEASGQQCR